MYVYCIHILYINVHVYIYMYSQAGGIEQEKGDVVKGGKR